MAWCFFWWISFPESWLAASFQRCYGTQRHHLHLPCLQVPLEELRAQIKVVEEDHSSCGYIRSWTEPDASAAGSEPAHAGQAAGQQQAQPSPGLLQYLGYQWFLQLEVVWDEAAGGVIGGVFVQMGPPLDTDVTGVPALTDFTLWSRKLTADAYLQEESMQGPVSARRGYGQSHFFEHVLLNSATTHMGLGMYVMGGGDLWIKLQVSSVC